MREYQRSNTLSLSLSLSPTPFPPGTHKQDKDAEVSALTQRVAETSEIQQKVLEKEAEVSV
jgi:hypothetical protein